MIEQPWPPEALRPDTLGQLYNEAYARAISEGVAPEYAHQAGCYAVHRHGHDHAMGVPSARRVYGEGPCTCTDGRCLVVETKAAGAVDAAEKEKP
jgi:hypothetical protein